MWIICNGAPKTGSTWASMIVMGAPGVKPVPDALRDPTWKNPSVREDLLPQASEILPPAPDVFASKQHWAHDKAARLLSIDGVKVINTIRDIRDTIVSRYHHDRRLNKERRDLADYIDARAGELVEAFCSYQRLWISKANANYHIAAYEHLSDKPREAIRDMMDFCGLDTSPSTLDDLTKATRITPQQGGFFRRGKPKSYEDELTLEQSDRIIDLARQGGLPQIKRDIALFRPEIRKYLSSTDVGVSDDR